jgi:hypothetical protein
VKAGYLSKEGKVNFLAQKRRWFVLKESFIYYYATISVHIRILFILIHIPIQDLKANGVILLHPGFDLGKNGRRELFIMTQGRVYSLEADTAQDRDAWLFVLEKYLNRPQIPLPPADPLEEKIIPEIIAAKQSPAAVVTGIVNSSANLIAMPFAVTQKVVHNVSYKVLPKTVYIDNVLFEGVLHKAGEINKSFQQRYWVLMDHTLYYFKDSVKAQTNASPAGFIPLDNCKVEIVEKPVRQFSFELMTPSRTYLLSADSQQSLEEWLGVLTKVTDSGTQAPAPSESILVPAQPRSQEPQWVGRGSLNDRIVDESYEGHKQNPGPNPNPLSHSTTEEEDKVPAPQPRKSVRFEGSNGPKSDQDYVSPRLAVRRSVLISETVQNNYDENENDTTKEAVPASSAEDRLWSNYRLKPPRKGSAPPSPLVNELDFKQVTSGSSDEELDRLLSRKEKDDKRCCSCNIL